MAADLLAILLKANLAAAVAILLVLALRKTVRKAFGTQIGYTLWAVAPLAVAASLAPARAIVVTYGPQAGPAAVDAAPVIASPALLPAMASAPAIDSQTLILSLWLTGAAISLAVLVWRQFRFMKGLGGVVREGRYLRARASGPGPAVVGALFPRIVLPSDFETRYEPGEQKLVLTHEAAHLVSGDAIVNAAVALARCLFWFNPLIHLAARIVRVDQELACDAAVLSAHPQMRRPYAEALLKTQIAAAPLPLGCYWPAGASHPLKERIAMLKLETPSAARKFAGAASVLALCLGAGAAAWAAQPATVTVIATPSATHSASATPEPEPASTLAAADAAQALERPTTQGATSPSPPNTPVEMALSPAGNRYRRFTAPPIVGNSYALRVVLSDGTPKTFLVPRTAPQAFAADETEAYRSARDTFEAALDEQAARAARNAPAQPLTQELQSAIQVMNDFPKQIVAKRMAEIDARYDRVTVALDGSTPPDLPSPRENSIMLLVPKNMTRVSKAAALTSVEIQLALTQPEAAPALRLKARAILDARPTID